MADRFIQLTGFILAGGKSERMGRPKPALSLGGQIQILRQARLLQSLCARVAVAGRFPGDRALAGGISGRPCERGGENGSPRDDPLVILDDVLPGLGPLGGVYTGLLRTRTEYNLFVGCDMPFLTVRFMRLLIRRAFASQADVTVPEAADRRFQGCCAVYRRRARAAIRASLGQSGNKVSSFYPRVRLQVIRWREISREGFGPDIFANMNTPGDYVAAKRVLEGGVQT